MMVEVAAGSFEGFVCILLLIIVCLLLCCIIYYLKKTNDALRAENKAYHQRRQCGRKLSEHCSSLNSPESIAVEKSVAKVTLKQDPKSDAGTPLLGTHTKAKPESSVPKDTETKRQITAPAPKNDIETKRQITAPAPKDTEKKHQITAPAPKNDTQTKPESTSPPVETHSTETITTITTYKVDRKPGQPDEVTKTVETFTIPEIKEP